MRKLIFNNYLSSTLKIIVVESPAEVLTTENVELIDVEGRNGSLLLRKGTYHDVEKEFTLTCSDLDMNIDEFIQNVNEFLFSNRDNKLIYYRDNKYNVVKNVTLLDDIQTSFEEFGDFRVSFLCEPFYYDLLETPITLTAPDMINNTGDFESEPVIKIFGNGNVQLTVKNETIQVNNVNEYVEIDSKFLLCLNSDKTNHSEYIGNFIKLDKGKNNVSWSGNVTKVEILIRKCYR